MKPLSSSSSTYIFFLVLFVFLRMYDNDVMVLITNAGGFKNLIKTDRNGAFEDFLAFSVLY